MSELRFGIVGCGSIGPTHAAAIAQVEGARLVAVCDLVPERAQALAEKYQCHCCQDYAEMLRRPDIDAVNICTPSGLHAEHGVLAARAGKHVLTEKPIDISLRRIDQLIAATEQAGVKLACIFQYRFNDISRGIKRDLDQGRFGRLLYANATVKWFRKQSYYDSGDWRGTWALDGGVLSNQAIHSIDQLTWFMGDFDRVEWAQIATLERQMEAEDWGFAVVRYRNGVAASVQASTLTWPGFNAAVEVYGTKGAAIVADGDNLLYYRVEGEQYEVIAGQKQGPNVSSDPLANPLTGHAAEIEDFVAAVRDDRDPFITGPEARKAVVVLTEIYRQALGYNPFER